jgi:hypothetical protein
VIELASCRPAVLGVAGVLLRAFQPLSLFSSSSSFEKKLTGKLNLLRQRPPQRFFWGQSSSPRWKDRSTALAPFPLPLLCLSLLWSRRDPAHPRISP